jgi:hypothetical protein
MAGRFDRAFFFLLDGARVDLFAEHLANGDLPNIARYMVEPGMHAAAVSVFPSVTGVAYVPYLTGMFPGRANLPGYRWFDRDRYQKRPLSMMRFRNYSGLGSYMMNRDLSKDATTLFELLRPSSNIFSGISRGTGFYRNAAFFRRIPAALRWFRTGDWDPIDAAGERFLLRAALRRRERFTFHTTYSIDEYSHHHGPFSARVRERYLDFDRVVGRLVARLKTTGQLERSLLMMGADHGHTEVKQHFDLEGFVERRGLKTLYFPKKFRNWIGAKAAVMVAGNGMGHVYLRGADAKWADRPNGGTLLAEDPTFIDDLLSSDGIDHVIFRPDDTGLVEVRSRRGRATIKLDGDLVHYSVLGTDPFDYPPLPPTMSRQQVLALTSSTNYPDAPLQVAQVFDSPRAGDFMISATKGWDLRMWEGKTDMQSCHGTLHREHMLVPFVTNHPVADPSRMPRSVDAFPTILELLGRPVPGNVDGVTLL